MGAYSFLTKKVGYQKANEIIQSNKTYTAKEVFDLGIINEICEEGYGIATMSSLIRNGELNKFTSNPFMTLLNKVSKEELTGVVDIWLERAFQLSEENLSRMIKLTSFQKRKVQSYADLGSTIEEESNFMEKKWP